MTDDPLEEPGWRPIPGLFGYEASERGPHPVTAALRAVPHEDHAGTVRLQHPHRSQ